jgi:outer membrane protein
MRIKLLGLLMIAGITTLSAQQGIKFGHINTEEVFMAMPELKQIQAQLEAEIKKQEDNLTIMNEDLKKKQEEYQSIASTLSETELSAKQTELMEMNQRLQNFYTLAQQMLQAKEQELKAPLLQKIQNAIEAVGNENGFLYIFEVGSGLPVYHSDKSVDVAPLVKAKLGITTTN